MRIKKGFELRDVCGEKVIIASGIENIDFSKMIAVNETAAYLWNALANGDADFTLTDAVDILRNEYEVSEEQAAQDVEDLLEVWLQQGIIEK